MAGGMIAGSRSVPSVNNQQPHGLPPCLYGFSLRSRTGGCLRSKAQRPKADGKGMVDDFDVEVRNKNLDRTCLVDELSGGQFVLVNEAVNLGIAIYNMWQGEGIRYETLFRDETVGALDAVNGKEYVRMLRRAMDLGGFHQVIFICHTQLVCDLADSVLAVGGGQVRDSERQMATALEKTGREG